MTFVVVAGGAAATAGAFGSGRYGRAAASLCASAVCGAATFGIALLLQTTSDATSSSGLSYYTDFWQPWWWLIVGLAILALGLVAALSCALRNRVSWSKRRLAYEIETQPTAHALRRLPPLVGQGRRPKIFPDTTPREQEECTSEQCELQVELPTAESPAAARSMLTSLARLLLLLSMANLTGGVILLGWMYGWAWVRSCETELGWLLPTLDCRFEVSEDIHSGSDSGSTEGNSGFTNTPFPSDWSASNVDTLLLAFLQMVAAVAGVTFDAILPACLIDCLALMWIVAKGCVFVAAVAEENAVGLVLVAFGDAGMPSSSSTSHEENDAVVWAPQRAAFLCIGLLATSMHLGLLLKMRRTIHSLWLWRQGVRRYKALQGWSPARAGWNINGDLEFVAGDVLLIDHEDSMYEEPSAREFDLLPFRYAEVEDRPRFCRCCLAQYRTKGGAVPMRLMEIILPDGEVKPDRTVQRLTTEILAAATEKTVDIMVEQSSYRPTQTVKTHPAARPHSAHSSIAESSDETDRSDSTPVSAPSQRLAVRRALSSVMRRAERDEVSRATAQTAAESDSLRSPCPETSATGNFHAKDSAQDRRTMAEALALKAKSRPFGRGGELPGLAQHSIAVSASEIGADVAQPFTRVMDTSQTLQVRFGPGLDDPFAWPRSTSARISSAGVVAVSMQGLQHELQHGGTHRKPAGAAGGLRSVRHRPESARSGSSTRPGSAHSSSSASSTRRRLSARDSVRALQVFEKLIADSYPPPLPGWTQHQDDCGDTYWYNAEEGTVTYAEPILPHRARHRVRRSGQEMPDDSRPYSAAARIATPAMEPDPRPHSASARLQNSQSEAIHLVGSSPSPGAEYGDNLIASREHWMMHRQMKLEQKLATVDLHADRYRVTRWMEHEDAAFAISGESLDASGDSFSTGGLEAVCGGSLVEEGKGWQIPVDEGLREYWGTAAGGGAGMERPQDIATIFRDVQACRGAVTKAMFDERWPGSPDQSEDRVVSQGDLYEYRDANDGAAMFLTKDSRAAALPSNHDTADPMLDISVAEWLGSINMGHHSHVLATLGTTFADFESLTAGDLFAAGIEQPDEISCILTRLRARIPDVRVLPRPISRTASHGSGSVARPGSARSLERSFAESQAPLGQSLEPDPTILSALVDQGIDEAAARRAAVANTSIEAAMIWCLTEKRPLPVLCPVDGICSVYITGVTGVEPPNSKGHDTTVRVRVGVQLVPNQSADAEESSEVTWSATCSTDQGAALVRGEPIRYNLRQGSQPLLRLMLVRCRKTGDQNMGAREVQLCRSLGPRWTPDVHLKHRFRVHDSSWGDELAIETVLVYSVDS
eukprot:COSAG02_NODE_588_length_19902_cov_115.928900_9_plen_1335_part_00